VIIVGLFDNLGDKFRTAMKQATSDACCDEDKKQGV